MKLTERIRNVNQLEITLWAVFVNTLLSLGINISYIHQGLADTFSKSAEAYYGGYVGPNAEGSLFMDILIVVLLAAVLVAVALTIKKKQSRYLLYAIIILLISIPFSQSYSSCLANLIICIFGFVYIKRGERNSLYKPKKTYLMTVVCSLYSLDAIYLGIYLILYLIDVIPKSTAPDLFVNQSFKGDGPEWMYWGIESPNTSFSIFDLIISIIPFVLMLTAVVCMYRAIRGRGRNISKLGATAFLLYLLLIVMIPYGEVDSLIFALLMPEALLSMYLLFHRAPLEGK